METVETVETSELLLKVEKKYRNNGISLTEKRLKVLTVLLIAKQSLSAYDIVDGYQQEFNQSIPAMSVYRILDFLIKIGAVHKLVSLNQFLVCEHAACEHKHQNVQFLICDECHSVQEVLLGDNVINSLNQSVKNAGFSLNAPQLELHGTCIKCLST